MESIIRNVDDLNAEERRMYESVVGRALREDQQVMIQVFANDSRRIDRASHGSRISTKASDRCLQEPGTKTCSRGNYGESSWL